MSLFHWDDAKSIRLTRITVALALAGCIAMTIGGPWLVNWMIRRDRLAVTGPWVGWVLLMIGYLCAAAALVMLTCLYSFLRRVEQGAVFTPANVTALRRISWCCVWAALLALPAGVVFYLPFFFIGVAAAFMALLVRVLKNAFAQAVRMKDELDYTI